MKIAYTMPPGRGDTDLLLFDFAQQLAKHGYRACGTVQINTECEGPHPCDMDVRVLPDGPVLRISQNLGRASKGCRLDPSTLEKAVALAMTNLERGADVLIVNKFGKHEAEGRGFRTVIAEALARDIPVVVGLNPLNEQAFQAFAGGCAVELRPDTRILIEYVAAQRNEAAQAM